MPLTLLEPPDLGPEFWDRSEIVDAVRLGRLDEFMFAFRGARRGWASQDQVARWIGCRQGTVSRIENDLAPATPQRVEAVFRGLHVPAALVRDWGGS